MTRLTPQRVQFYSDRVDEWRRTYSNATLYEEGWSLYAYAASGDLPPKHHRRLVVRIEKVDRLKVFATDQEAELFVAMRATEGSRRHMEALRIVLEAHREEEAV